MQKIIPFLWYEGRGEEAAKFYVDIFNNAPYGKKNSKVGRIARYDEASSEVSGQPAGSILTVEFELAGQNYVALNGGPQFKFTEAVSFMISCKDQKEVDYFWDKLTDGGEESVCGWLKDKFGLSWQVVPTRLTELMGGHDKAKAGKAMKAMLGMKKIIIADLE